MKNFAQLYLLAALTVAPSLAADISPRPLFNRGFQQMGDPKPGSEKFYLGIVLATGASSLRKRQIGCLAGRYLCPNTEVCCPTGSTCEVDSVGPHCRSCDPGYFRCTTGVARCCENGYACIGEKSCSKPCPLISTRCGDGCCELGFSCNISELCTPIVGPISLPTIIPVPTNSRVATSLVNSLTTIPTTTKAVTSSTTLVSPSATIPPTTKAATTGTYPVNPFTTTPRRSTSTIANSDPTRPSMTESENSSRGTESLGTGPSSPTIAPESGGNSLKPAGWLAGFGLVFLFAFFHI